MSWTEERTDALKKLWAEGYSASQIAKLLGETTRNAVVAKVWRLGLDGRCNPAKPGEHRAPKAGPAPVTRSPRAPQVKRAPSQNNGLNASRRKPVATPVIVAGNSTIHEAQEAREPLVIVPKEAWAPLPGSTPRPWTERGEGCKWPVDVQGAAEQHSCCLPRAEGHPNYCDEHVARSVSKANAAAPRGSELVRSLRRYAA